MADSATSTDSSQTTESQVVDVLQSGIPDYSLSDLTIFSASDWQQHKCWVMQLLRLACDKFVTGDVFFIMGFLCEPFPSDYLFFPQENGTYDLKRVVVQCQQMYEIWYNRRAQRGDFNDYPGLEAPTEGPKSEMYAAEIYGLVKVIFEAEAYRTHARMNPNLPVEMLKELDDKIQRSEKSAIREAGNPTDWRKGRVEKEDPDEVSGIFGRETEEGGFRVDKMTEKEESEDSQDQREGVPESNSFVSNGSSSYLPPGNFDRTKDYSLVEDACDQLDYPVPGATSTATTSGISTNPGGRIS